MAERDPVRVFVTHAWESSADYQHVFEFLEGARNFIYRNCSTPEKLPTESNVESRREDLRRQINAAEVVLALASLQQTHAELLVFQVNYAKSSDKPVILLPSFGRELAVPSYITGVVDEQVAWDARAMVDAIMRQARHQETQRWDTIEFKLD
jgi:hypothetical protein